MVVDVVGPDLTPDEDDAAGQRVLEARHDDWGPVTLNVLVGEEVDWEAARWVELNFADGINVRVLLQVTRETKSHTPRKER